MSWIRCLLLGLVLALGVHCLPTSADALGQDGQSPVDKVIQLRQAVDVWLGAYNHRLRRVRHTTAALAWDMSVNTTEQSMQRLAIYGQDPTFDESPPEADSIRRYSELLTPLQTRQIGLISDRPHYPENMYMSARSLLVQLERTFSSATVCDRRRCYHGEPDLQTVMETSRDPARLLWAWRGWRRAVGPPMRAIYPDLVRVLNAGARHAGFADMGAVWRHELEMPDIEQTARGLSEEVRPLYEQLHALVRSALRRHYGPKLVSSRGPIPAHLLGNLWSQSWESLADIVNPFPGAQQTDLSKRLADQFSVKDFVKVAENFYMSLGLPPMTEKFWKNSIFQRPADGRNMTCHASSADFYTDDDFRILMCLERNERDFGVLHHEMGHIQYFMAYRHLPTVLRDGANSAFHEAVGDTFFYSIFGPAHLHRLGLAEAPTNSSQTGEYRRKPSDRTAAVLFGRRRPPCFSDADDGRRAPLTLMVAVLFGRRRPPCFSDADGRRASLTLMVAVLFGRRRPPCLSDANCRHAVRTQTNINEHVVMNVLDVKKRGRGLQLLLQRALAKVPLIGFSLALDTWRWRVYGGKVQPRDYNAAWWQLRETLSGVRHPDCSAETMKATACNQAGMDPGAKFHVADNIPHIRYFLAVFLQLQFFEGLCEAKYGSPLPIPLHECDLYGSHAAGNKLMAMMSLGKSRSWQDALEVITGSRQISAKPLLRYFKPLYDWLVAENRRTQQIVGWMTSE
ncbi:angiotensin-converting enzyme-like [Pollicipes pollicipes]|uniref:angiotensin-converting enzyme-like n=1 Tax=Pollicipes pollicipes TaxID=41117 RepID=UPI001884B760|nr:angiotensin-converting enzyme-like [Pollicipes pollicipes]